MLFLFIIYLWLMLDINRLVAIKKWVLHFSLLDDSRLKAPQLTEHLVTRNSLGQGTGERALKMRWGSLAPCSSEAPHSGDDGLP